MKRQELVNGYRDRLAKAIKVNDIGCCNDWDLFKEIMSAFPKSRVELTLRNYANETIRAIVLRIPGIDQGSIAPCGRVYFLHQRPTELCPALANRLGGYSFLDYVEQGQRIADALGREIRLIRQYGSGNQEEATYAKPVIFKPRQE